VKVGLSPKGQGVGWGSVLENRVLMVILEPKVEEVQDGHNYVMRTFIIGTHQILVGAANVGR